jgi:glycosyltransferase involved in cell wall biosynthesis
MRFVIITHVLHTIKDSKIYGYAPYIKEMNLWLKYVDNLKIVGPVIDRDVSAIDLAYKHSDIDIIKTKPFNLTTAKDISLTLMRLPLLCVQIIQGMYWAEHIHLRCPGNMGLLGSVLQIFFPHKPKTAKYAGNWDPNAHQPWSYRLQKWILSNTFLTKNMKVLVYGEWENQTKNIVPFFTATYSQNEIEDIHKDDLNNRAIHLIYVGTISENKRPFLSVKTAHKLIEEGIEVRLDMFGDGNQKEEIQEYIDKYHLSDYITLHGNQNSAVIKKYYQQSDFLIFISKSEGWPKVVAEAMFWGCLPITTDVSCVRYMIGDGNRGQIVEPNIDDIVDKIKYYLNNPQVHKTSINDAIKWSRQYTLEYFEQEIKRVLND